MVGAEGGTGEQEAHSLALQYKDEYLITSATTFSAFIQRSLSAAAPTSGHREIIHDTLTGVERKSGAHSLPAGLLNALVGVSVAEDEGKDGLHERHALTRRSPLAPPLIVERIPIPEDVHRVEPHPHASATPPESAVVVPPACNTTTVASLLPRPHGKSSTLRHHRDIFGHYRTSLFIEGLPHALIKSEQIPSPDVASQSISQSSLKLST